MKVYLTLIFILALYGCSSDKGLIVRGPSTESKVNSCLMDLRAFFADKKAIEGVMLSEADLINKGMLDEGELASILKDPAFKNIIDSESIELREDTAKTIALLKRYRPDMPTSKLSELYHKLFNTCL